MCAEQLFLYKSYDAFSDLSQLLCLQASQVQQSQGSWSEGEPIELSGLADVDWQSKQRQAQQDTAAIQKKIAVARSMLYLTPLLREEPVSMPLVANALVHEVMSSMTARSGADQQHDTELRVLCLVSLLGLAARRPSIVDVMSIEMHSDLTLPNADELSGHALLSHIAAGLLRSQSLPQVCSLSMRCTWQKCMLAL